MHAFRIYKLKPFFIGLFLTVTLCTLVTCQVLNIDEEEKPVPVTGVVLNKAETQLGIGSKEYLFAIIYPASATNRNVSWTSSNPNVATVSSLGLVTGIAPGITTITVKTEDGGFTSDCQVTISNTIVANPDFSVNGGTFASSQTITLSSTTDGATIYYTTDGSDPKTSLKRLTGISVFVSMPMIIKAYAHKDGMQDSSVVESNQFTITSGIVFVSTQGLDDNQGTKEFPKRTIQAACNLAHNLFTTGEVHIAQGTYEFSTDFALWDGISLYGGYSNDFSMRNITNNVTKIKDTRTTGTANTLIATNLTSTIKIDGFTMEGPLLTDNNISCCIVITNSNLVISNNIFISGSSTYIVFGLAIDRTSSSLIYNNIFYGGSSTNNIMTCIFIKNNSTPKIYNNTIVVGDGVNRWAFMLRTETYGTPHPYLKNNLLVVLGATGSPGCYHMNSGSGNYPYAYTTNLFWVASNANTDGAYIYYGSGNTYNINNTNYTTQAAYIYPSGSQILTYNDAAWKNIVNQDPLFVNASANDYHLQVSSPAKSAGTDLSLEIPALDRDGNLRTSPWSIGAYEKD